MAKYRIMYVAVLGLIAFCLLIGFVGASTFQNYTTAGTYYWIVPEGVSSVIVKAVGSGSGGAGGGFSGMCPASQCGCDYPVGSYTNLGGGGGASGAYVTQTVNVTSGQNITISIGNPGTGGSHGTSTTGYGGVVGTTGGSTSLTGTGVSISAPGGNSQSPSYNSASTGGSPNGNGGTAGQGPWACGASIHYGGTGGASPYGGYGKGGDGGSSGTTTTDGSNGVAGFVSIEYTAVSLPVAGFSGTPTSGTVPLTVTFTDSSTNTPTSWLWDFHDGSTTNNTQQNPVHTFSSAGTYEVDLQATNAGGSDWENKTAYITTTTPTTVPTTTVTTVVTTVPTTTVTTAVTTVPTTYPTAGPTPIAWYNDKSITQISSLHTYEPSRVTQKCAVMEGSTDTYGTVWFVYGAAHNTYNWKTKDQVKGGNFNQSQCNFPLFPGKTYYYRAASASGYGAEYNFTMPALGVRPTSTYGHYAEEFIETEGNITAAGEIIFDPYTDKWGTIFISMLIGMIFVAICLKQNSSATPAILAFIVGVPLFALMAPEYIRATQALLMVAVAGMIYYVFARRR